jgi:parallel beta-helix repeat protein
MVFLLSACGGLDSLVDAAKQSSQEPDSTPPPFADLGDGGRYLFVSPTGDDATADPSNPATPLRTLAALASLAGPGDICYLREGVYRETLDPLRSGADGNPIRFLAYPNERPVISGADVVTGWTPHSSVGTLQVYKASPGFAAKQLFIDGQLQNEARFPNAVSRNPMLKRGLMKVDVSATATAGTGLYKATVQGMDQSLDFWAGAKIWGYFDSTGRSVSEAGLVVGSEPGILWLSKYSATRLWGWGKGDAYIYGVKAAIDVAGEWAADSGDLYLGGAPSGLVEAKRRDLALDLRNLSYIEVKGVEIRAATASLDQSHHILLDGVDFSHVAHDQFTRSGWNHDLVIGPNSEGTGVLVGGHHNTLKNCKVSFSAGDGITVYGADNVVENCIVRDVNYRGSDSALISVEGTRQTIRRNTLYNAIRSGIVHRNLTSSVIRENHVYNVGLHSSDLGITYSHLVDAAGTELSYNWLHHNFSGGDRYETLGNGIYLDANAEDFVVHHNVVWSCPHSSLIFVSGSTRDALFYNNTLWSNWRGLTGNGASNIQIINNLSNKAIESSGTLATNLVESVLSLQNVWNGLFDLLGTSSALDTATVISGISDVYVGAAPDIGAYERGAARWIPGRPASADNHAPAVSLVSPRRMDSGRSGIAMALKAQAFDPDGSVTRVEFYDQDVLLGEGSLVDNLWTYSLTAPATGDHVFFARAYDAQGASSDSNPVSVYIGPRNAFGEIWAETLDDRQGIVTDGWSGVSSVDNGEWMLFKQVDFGNAGVSSFRMRIALPDSQAGRTFTVLLDSLTGTPISTLTTTGTGGWGTYVWQESAVSASVTGVRDVYVRVSGGNGAGNIDMLTFTKP